MRKGQVMSEVQKRKIRETEVATKIERKKQNPNRYSFKKSDAQKEKIREANIKTWQNPELRERSSNVRKKQGNFREGTKHSDSTKEKMRIRGKERWCNPAYIQKIKIGMDMKPTKPERTLIELLNKWYPNLWKYVGDWSFWIENRNPDFVNVNGKKLIIEFDGEYWHGLQKMIEKDKLRNATYERYGYKMLSINYADLKDIVMLKKKIQEFAGEVV